MKSIQYFPTVTDIVFRIEANTLPELYKAGLMGMSNLLKNKSCQGDQAFTLEHSIEIKSIDRESLLVDFLERILVLSQVQHAIFCQLSEIVIYNNFMKAVVKGFPVDAFDMDVKNVGFSGTDIAKSSKNRWEASLKFDYKTSQHHLN